MALHPCLPSINKHEVLGAGGGCYYQHSCETNDNVTGGDAVEKVIV
jgi:hypothetical protein